MKYIAIISAASFATMAQAVDFDFESESPGIYNNGTTFSSGGIDLTLASQGGGRVHLFELTASGLGKGVLGSDSNSLGFSTFQPLVHTFSTDIQSATFRFGDNGSDNDGNVNLQLFDSSNNLITTLSSFFGTTAGNSSITVNQTFRSARFTTDAGFNPHSLIQEWTDVQAVPEPATLSVLALGALAAYRKKYKSK